MQYAAIDSDNTYATVLTDSDESLDISVQSFNYGLKKDATFDVTVGPVRLDALTLKELKRLKKEIKAALKKVEGEA